MEENKHYLTNDFLEHLYKSIQPEEDLLNCPKERIDEVRQDGIGRIREILKIDELKKMFDLNIKYELDSTMESMGVSIEKYQLNAVQELPFPVYHILPNQPNGKVILYLHGHDDLGIMGALLERYDKERYHKMIPLLLAKEGYHIIAPELIGYGDARFFDFPTGTEKLNGCVANSHYLTLAGFNIAGFRVYQAMRTLDYMEKIKLCEDVTVFGISGGGMISQQLAVIDGRIHKVLIASYANTYRNSVLNKEHCIDNYVPGLLRAGDSYKLLSLVAPRPLLTVNGISDRAFPEAGSKIAFDFLEKVYERLGVSNHYQGILFEGMHEIKSDIIIKWLKENA